MEQNDVKILRLRALDFIFYKSNIENRVFKDITKSEETDFIIFLNQILFYLNNYELFQYEIISKKEIELIIKELLSDSEFGFLDNIKESEKKIIVNSQYYLNLFNDTISDHEKNIKHLINDKVDIPFNLKMFVNHLKFMNDEIKYKVLKKINDIYYLDGASLLFLINNKNDLLFFIKEDITLLEMLVQAFFEEFIGENFSKIKNENNLKEYNFLIDLLPYLKDDCIMIHKKEIISVFNEMIINGETDYLKELLRIVNKKFLIDEFEQSDFKQFVNVYLFGIKNLKIHENLIKKYLNINVKFQIKTPILNYVDFIYEDRLFLMSLSSNENELKEIIKFITVESGYEIKIEGLIIRESFKELLIVNYKK